MSTFKTLMMIFPGQEIKLHVGHNCQGSGQDTLCHISQGEIVKDGRRIVKTMRPGIGRVICYSPTQRGYELEVEGVKMLLGYWWLEDCARAGPDYCPIVNCKPSIIK